jgi:hypothetical protein
MVQVMTEDEAEKHIVNILKKHGPLTTRKLEEKTRKEGRQCPDGTLQFLTKLRFRGIIKGEVSTEHRGWIWWLPED